MRDYSTSANVGPIRMVKENGGSSIKPRSPWTLESLSTGCFLYFPFCHFVLQPFHFCINIASFCGKLLAKELLILSHRWTTEFELSWFVFRFSALLNLCFHASFRRDFFLVEVEVLICLVVSLSLIALFHTSSGAVGFSGSFILDVFSVALFLLIFSFFWINHGSFNFLCVLF